MTSKRNKKRTGRAILIGIILFGITFGITWWRSQQCEVCGIDVSHYQGKIDWKAVAQEEIKFAFVKATEGSSLADETFAGNWEAAGKAKVLRGAYHFFRPGTDATAQAEFFLKTTKGLHTELPPVLDLEVTGQQSASEIQKGVKTWMVAVEKATGRKPLLYTMPQFADSYLGDDLSEYPLWVVDLRRTQPRLPKSWDKWTFRQYSHTGKLKGIDGDVDLNCFNGTAEELAALTKTN